ncbi:MAG: YbaB/EbfC family nucleoid-associated protein [Bacillus subtilis]|jgi:nucleoid-associated protein EbfC|nr:YbaB/EbfC family nucleoid-associated protein [Bacillus subtilis]
MINPQMMKKLQKMQEDMKKAQAEINQSTFYGQAGGSMVKVSVKGTKEILSVQIKKDEVDMNDIDMLQDLIVVAVNDALRRVDKEIEETIGSITQGMRMPGMF